MKFITTCSKEGYEAYGHRLVESFHNAPDGSTLVVYTEGFEVPNLPRVEQVPLDHVQDLTRFKARYANYVAPSWEYDVVKFSHKIFAMAHGAMAINAGIVCWVDADCVFHKPMPADVLGRLLGDAYVAYYGRKGLYTETGFWYVNAAHPAHMTFMDMLTETYTKDRFRALPQWHDCFVFDYVRKRMERDGMIKSVNLSGEADTHTHPMAVTEIGQWLDHRKGQRKALDLSPENPASGVIA